MNERFKHQPLPWLLGMHGRTENNMNILNNKKQNRKNVKNMQKTIT